MTCISMLNASFSGFENFLFRNSCNQRNPAYQQVSSKIFDVFFICFIFLLLLYPEGMYASFQLTLHLCNIHSIRYQLSSFLVTFNCCFSSVNCVSCMRNNTGEIDTQ